MKQHYVDPATAEKMADYLLREDKAGVFENAKTGAAFTNLLTKRLRAISSGAHLIVVYSETPSLPNRPHDDASKALAQYQAAMRRQNCTFAKVATLPHKIGYLKLNSFPDPFICEATATAALKSVNHADAIFFDLPGNRGGFPQMIAIIAAWLFDHPEFWYNPRRIRPATRGRDPRFLKAGWRTNQFIC